ncbi:MAG: hypothetical protein MK111_23590, partial [Crocosphaera sp.]
NLLICQKILGQKWHKFWRNFFSKPYVMLTENMPVNASTIDSLSHVIQAELNRLFPPTNYQESLYFEFTEDMNVYIFNCFDSQLCSFPKLMKTLKNTKSASLNYFAPDNIWDILASCCP